MYSIYQNRYANKLHLNIIRLKYSKEHTIFERDFAIKLSEDYTGTTNDLITYKLYLSIKSYIWYIVNSHKSFKLIDPIATVSIERY